MKIKFHESKLFKICKKKSTHKSLKPTQIHMRLTEYFEFRWNLCVYKSKYLRQNETLKTQKKKNITDQTFLEHKEYIKCMEMIQFI